MSLIVRCEWSPAAASSIEERVAEVASLLQDPAVTPLVGAQWYGLGRSRKQALSKPVPVGELDEIKRWRRVKLIPGQNMYCLELWNGREHPETANFDVALSSTPDRSDTLVFASLDADFLRSRGLAWGALLSCARQVADRLGGVAIVSSHELLDMAKEWQLRAWEHAAYAAFWGVDRSGRNPRHLAAARIGVEVPFEKVVCDCWSDLRSPSRSGVQEVIALLDPAGASESRAAS